MRLVFKGPPVEKERHRDRKTLRFCPRCGCFIPKPKKSKYNPKEKDEHAVGWEAKSQKPRGTVWPLKGNLSVEMIFHPDRTEILVSESVIERPKGVKPDLSNLCKFIEDACNRIVWGDDKQIVDLRARFPFKSVNGEKER